VPIIKHMVRGTRSKYQQRVRNERSVEQKVRFKGENQRETLKKNEREQLQRKRFKKVKHPDRLEHC